ncbi:MAG TPA: tetratricopeptide repeat protein [Planktothrix sp.]|jgi:tetratricopeptide (TPR) repeat protein
MNSTALAIALYATLLGLPVFAADRPTDPAAIAREEGLRDLGAGRYQIAAAYLKQATKEAPKDPALHYYLANALVYLNKHQEAITEYQRSYTIDPYGPVSGYCRRALKTYHATIPEGTTDGDEPPPALAQIQKAIAAEPQLSTGINATIGKIRSQAQDEKDRHRTIAASLSSTALKTGEANVKQIQEDANAEIERILNPVPIPGRSPYNPILFNPELQKARAEEVRKNAEEAARIARETATEKANTFQRWSQYHDVILDSSADALERQLHERNLPGTPRLTEIGTGLYVRNYTQPSEPSPYPEAHQGVARIKRVVYGPQEADRGNEQELKAREDTDQPGNTVRGTVLIPSRPISQ